MIVIVVVVVNVNVNVFGIVVVVVFYGKLKTRVPGGKKPLEEGNQQQTQPMEKKLHCFCDSGPGHIGRRQVLNHHTTIAPKNGTINLGINTT